MSDLVRVERKGRVTTVILNRPASRNAVNGPTAAALCAAFEQFDRDDAASVAVLWGAGGTFCAGSRFEGLWHTGGQLCAPDGSRPDGAVTNDAVQTCDRRRQRLRRRRGLELALWCDLRVAEEDAVFGVFCRRWGYRSSTAAPCDCHG